MQKKREEKVENASVCGVQDATICTGKTPSCVEHAGVFPVHTEAS